MNYSDIKLGYSAGCGGFLALHLLLLSGQHKCWLGKNLDDVIDQQWNISDHTKWKSTECWPQNDRTVAIDGPKILFYCNPAAEHWSGAEHKIFLYSDLASQLALAKYKNAWIYLPSVDRTELTLDYLFFELYQKLREYIWPDCATIQDSRLLPDRIRKELEEHPDYQALLSATSWEQWWTNSPQHVTVNNCTVTAETAMFVQSADQSLTLQEMVNSQGAALLQPLGLTVTDSHRSLIKRWIKLHPPELLQSVGINVALLH